MCSRLGPSQSLSLLFLATQVRAASNGYKKMKRLKEDSVWSSCHREFLLLFVHSFVSSSMLVPCCYFMSLPQMVLLPITAILVCCSWVTRLTPPLMALFDPRSFCSLTALRRIIVLFRCYVIVFRGIKFLFVIYCSRTLLLYREWLHLCSGT